MRRAKSLKRHRKSRLVLNGADIFVLAVVLISTLAGVMRGFVREAVALAFLVGGVVAAWMLGPRLEP
ncbi:MAG: CvpA family protein, partial [Gammaproteobacteria bacterium]|nr:CvpA family protein [Gammaproteobacteria bacterium]